MAAIEMSSAPTNYSNLPSLTLTEKLRLAASKGQLEKVQEYVQSGASFQPDKEGRSALHYAALNGYVEVCRYLLSQQCPTDIQDAVGFTPLHRAASQGHIEVMRLLLEDECAVDIQDEHGNAALHESAWNGFSSALELLIKHNCNIVVANKAGFTALHLASQNGHNQSTRVLLYGGCNPDLKNNYGDTAMHTAARYGHAGVTRILISARCCLNEQNKNGDTALHIAAALKRRKIAKLLVEAKIDVSIRNKQNETACDVARRKEHPEIILIITTLARHKTSKPVHHKEVNFKDMPDGPVVVPDEEIPIKTEKPVKEKTRFSFFKKKKPKEKEKGIEMQTMSSGGFRKGEKSVTGFFSQYVPRTGNQYYRDLAGNIKQGPIGYTPLCQCGPALHRLEQQVHTDHDNIYQHMDASHKVLHNRIDQLDRRTAQQVYSMDKLTKERLQQEEQKCNTRIRSRLEEEKIYSANQYQGQMEQLLEAKLASYGHCLDHHHDDSVLPSNNFFTDIHQTANGRLFKSRSDETLSQSDYSGKFRKKQFYESRQAAMQQMRAWQVPNTMRDKDTRRDRIPKVSSQSQGQIYSKHGQVPVGQIQVHALPGRNREDHYNGQYDMLSPSTDSTSQRTPIVQSPMDCDMGVRGQGAIPKRLIPHSQTWHNSQQLRDSGMRQSPINHSTPKAQDNTPYEVMHPLTRPGSGGMVRSHTDNDGLYRANTSRQSFPERGSSNTNAGTNQTSSGAGQGPPGNKGQSSTMKEEGDQGPEGNKVETQGKGPENKPTFTTFGYPDKIDSRDQNQNVIEDNMPNIADSKDMKLRPGSSLREESPYGPYPSKPPVAKKPENIRNSIVSPAKSQGPLRNFDNKQNDETYGYYVRNNKEDMYMSMQQQRPLSGRQRSHSSEGILLDESELTSAHEMARVKSEDRSQPGRVTSAIQQNYNGYNRPPQGQGQYSSQGHLPNNRLPNQRTNARPYDQGHYNSTRPESHYGTVRNDRFRYDNTNTKQVSVENPYSSNKDISRQPQYTSHQVPYHSTYHVNRVGQQNSEQLQNNSEKTKMVSKSESNLMDRSHDENSHSDYICQTPEDSPRDIKSVANYPSAYNKEDSSSNPDSGYSSKIFGNRLHPGNPRSNTGTPSFNSASPSFNSGTPSSSFSADHSLSTPGQSHTSSPQIHVSSPDYEQFPPQRDQFNNNLKNHVNNWYHRQLQDAALRLKDGTYVTTPQKQYQHPASIPSPAKVTLGSNHSQPPYGQTPPQQYGTQSPYSNSQGYPSNQMSYANYQHVSNFVRGSDV